MIGCREGARSARSGRALSQCCDARTVVVRPAARRDLDLCDRVLLTSTALDTEKMGVSEYHERQQSVILLRPTQGLQRVSV